MKATKHSHRLTMYNGPRSSSVNIYKARSAVDKYDYTDPCNLEMNMRSGISRSDSKSTIQEIIPQSCRSRNNNSNNTILRSYSYIDKLMKSNTLVARKDAYGVEINNRNKQLYKVSFIDKISSRPFATIITGSIIIPNPKISDVKCIKKATTNNKVRVLNSKDGSLCSCILY